MTDDRVIEADPVTILKRILEHTKQACIRAEEPAVFDLTESEARLIASYFGTTWLGLRGEPCELPMARVEYYANGGPILGCRTRVVGESGS